MTDLTLITEILSGKHDDRLDNIVEAVRQRRQYMAKITTASLTPGDEVRFSDQIRPKYLVGRTAKVVKINRESVVVNCPDDPAYGRFRNLKRVRCPNSLIEGAV